MPICTGERRVPLCTGEQRVHRRAEHRMHRRAEHHMHRLGSTPPGQCPSPQLLPRHLTVGPDRRPGAMSTARTHTHGRVDGWTALNRAPRAKSVRPRQQMSGRPGGRMSERARGRPGRSNGRNYWPDGLAGQASAPADSSHLGSANQRRPGAVQLLANQRPAAQTSSCSPRGNDAQGRPGVRFSSPPQLLASPPPTR